MIPTLRAQLYLKVLVWLLTSIAAYATHKSVETQLESLDVFDMSLEELGRLDVRAPSVITALDSDELPASVTLITADQIRLSPHRNLYDLIETYVPGAIWMRSEPGPQLGVRGNIVDRSSKYLLVLNGRIMNNKAHWGARPELEHWDLGDIEKVEIIRGPGSVTYGAGAIAGVIRITTYDASTAEGSRLSTRYVSEYDSYGASFSHTFSHEQIDFYTYFSIVRTEGQDADQYQVNGNDAIGYVGRDIATDTPAMEYFADYLDDPQIKLHIDADFGEHWSAWFRYTQQGATWRSNETKSAFGDELLNQQGIQDRQVTFTVEHERDLSEALSWNLMLSLDSYDTVSRRDRVRDATDPGGAANTRVEFSESEFFAQNQFNWNVDSTTEVAFGLEYALDYFGPGWGDDDRKMRIGDDGTIVNGPDSYALNADGSLVDSQLPAILAGDGFTSHTFSVFAEGNVQLDDHLKTLISARADKVTYADWQLSPRLALIYEAAPGHTLRLIGQQSSRTDTAAQLLTEHRNGTDIDSEEVQSVELIYSRSRGSLNFNLASYVYELEVIAWDNDNDATEQLGDLLVAGFEADATWSFGKGQLGGSYSLTKQLSWDMGPGVTASGVSYADYNQVLRNSSAVFTGTGNDLNNWPNSALKFYGHYHVNDRLTFHADARLLWDYQGAKDGLIGLSRAVAGTSDEAGVESALAAVRERDVYELDFRLNASALYKLNERVDLMLYAQNLLGYRDNKRYAYDFGNNRASPRRVRFIEEPRTFGIRVDYSF